MPYVQFPVVDTNIQPYQDEEGYDPTAEGQQDPAEQSEPEHAYDATPGSNYTWDRWRKTIDGGAANMDSGQPTGAGWAPDGTSDASRWKGV
jgi:hypothetical protein